MKIRTRLYMNTIATLLGAAVIGGAGLVGMKYIHRQLVQVIEKTAPYQVKTIEVQRALQEHISNLLNLSSVASVQEMERAAGRVRESLAEADRLSREVAAMRGGAGMEGGNLREIEAITKDIVEGNREKVLSEEKAQATSVVMAEKLKHMTGLLDTMSGAMNQAQKDSYGDITKTNQRLSRTVRQFRALSKLKDQLREAHSAVFEAASAETESELAVAKGRLSAALKGAAESKDASPESSGPVGGAVAQVERDAAGQKGIIAMRQAILAGAGGEVRREFDASVRNAAQKLDGALAPVETQIGRLSETLAAEGKTFDTSVESGNTAGDLLSLNREIAFNGLETARLVHALFTEGASAGIDRIEKDLRSKFENVDIAAGTMASILAASGSGGAEGQTRQVLVALKEIQGRLWTGDGIVRIIRNKIAAEVRAAAQREKLKQLVERERTQGTKGVLAAQGEQAKAALSSTRVITLSLALGAVVLAASILSAQRMTRKIVSGLSMLVEYAGKIAGGELRDRVPEEGYDEIRALARAFNAMSDSLRLVLSHIQETGNGIRDFADGMSAVIREEAEGAVTQSASVGQVTATIEELSRTSRQISHNALAVKDAAAEAVGTARKGAVLGQGSIEAMDQIRGSVEAIAQKTVFLGDRSREIGKVMGIIREISSEIHLLSLNAAIESAAAGEHGRRFAVVASEVRRLAEKARESAGTIGSIVSEIQGAISGSVETTRRGVQNIEAWRETILASADAFQAIISTIEKTSEASSQTSMAVQQQTVAQAQVVRSMQEISAMVAATAEKMRRSSGSTAELNRMTEKLETDVLHFSV